MRGDGLFVHPVQDEAVMAGNGTIGLEIVEDLPDVDAVVCPFRGGGLVAGIESAVKDLSPRTRVYTVEPETAAPLARSLAAGEPKEVDYRPSFVDGAGGRLVLPTMWPRLRQLVDGALVATLDETAAAIRLLAMRAPGRGGRRGVGARRRPGRARGRRPGRLRRVRRQHRPGASRPHPGWRDAAMRATGTGGRPEAVC